MIQKARTITTVTLNPAIDEALSVDAIAVGETNRCNLDCFDPGGKGINASRVIRRLGRETLALGFAGGITGALLRARLAEEFVPHELLEAPGSTRVNVMLYERVSGRCTRLYLPGQALAAEHLELLRSRLSGLEAGAIVVVGGSLPPGLPVDTYRVLCSWLRERGARIILDTSGAALDAALASEPWLVKPDIEEAQELVGYRIANDADALRAASELCARGPRYVVISQGKNGAVGVGPEGAWKVTAPTVAARSTVGSGDSMVAGLAIGFAEDGGLAEGLRLGSAAGAATALRIGTHLCDPADVERLLVEVAVSPCAIDSIEA